MHVLRNLLASLLFAATAFGQSNPVYFSSAVTLDHPAYGFKYELYNPGPGTIYIDSIRVTASFDSLTYPGYQFALVPEVAPQTNCTSYAILNEDLTDPGQQVVNGSTHLSRGHIHALPCSQPYAGTTLGCNSTSCVGFDEFVLTPGDNKYFYDRSTRPIPLSSGKALGLWGTAVTDPYTAAMTGILRVTYHWHQ